MPVIAAPIFWAAVAGGGAGLAGAAINAHAQGKAGDQAATAAEDAAKRESDAAAAALQFQQQQAAQTRADNIAAQQANFGQWGYRQNSIRPLQASGLQANNTLAQLLGLPAQNTQLPDLPPQPNFANTGAPNTSQPSSSGGGSRTTPKIDPSKDIAPQVSAYFKSQGVSDAETPYWVQKWSEFGSKDPNYFAQRLASADVFGGASGASSTSQPLSIMPPKPLGNGQNLSFVPGSLGSIAMA